MLISLIGNSTISQPTPSASKTGLFKDGVMPKTLTALILIVILKLVNASKSISNPVATLLVNGHMVMG